jgi:DNA-binding winged helix-turn-helix (wHTH) protein
MHAPDSQVFEFGDFVLATKERLLLCGGEPVPLTGKAFDLLIALVRRSGHLVSKDELLREVWPDTFVEEVNLSVNISALRKALERGGGNGMILTVPKRGYRFVATVKAANAATVLILRDDSAGQAFRRVPEPRQIAPARPAQRPGVISRRGGALIAAALVCAAFGIFALWMRPENIAAPPRSAPCCHLRPMHRTAAIWRTDSLKPRSTTSRKCGACALHRGPTRLATRGRGSAPQTQAASWTSQRW